MNTEFEKSNDYNTITLSVGNDTDTPKEIKLTPEGSSYFENDSPEISEKDFQDMYISQGKNEMEKMERRFEIWLENRDDDFTLDMWDFRCLQSFIDSEIQLAEQKAREEERERDIGIIEKYKENSKESCVCVPGEETCYVCQSKYHDEDLQDIIKQITNS